MRRLGACVVALTALAATACTTAPVVAPPPPRPSPTPPASPVPSPPSGEGSVTTRPLVLAVNARRPPLELTEAQADRVMRGAVTDWRQLGEAGGPLLVSSRTDRLRHLPMDTVAITVADAVDPSVRVATVGGVDPIRDPAAYPLQVQGPGPRPVTTVTVVGDIMLGRGVAGAEALRPMSARLASADITVGNLESTLAELGPPQQDPVTDSFSASPDVRAGLRAAGFDALSLANNHTGDFGDASLERTVGLLRAGGLETFGAGRDLAQAREPVVIERNGMRFGFLGFNAIGETPEAAPGRPGALSVSMPPRTGPLDRGELDRVLADVRRLERLADVVVVLPHWGTQYSHRPEPVQHQVARELADAGADLVVGGHPHWVQGAEQVGGALVVHSLGNFVFDMDFMTQTMEGLVLEATFWGNQLMAAEFVPYRMGPDFAPRVVPRAEAASILDPFWDFSSLAATR